MLSTGDLQFYLIFKHLFFLCNMKKVLSEKLLGEYWPRYAWGGGEIKEQMVLCFGLDHLSWGTHILKEKETFHENLK